MIRMSALVFCLALFASAAHALDDTVLSFPIIGNAGVAAVTTDEAGNIYVAGSFSKLQDFNPGVGVDSRRPVGATDAYITRFNRDGTYVWTQTFGGTLNDVTTGIVVASGTVYAVGSFEGSTAGVNVAGTIASAGLSDAFVLALDAATGAPLPAFSGDGVQIFGGSGTDGSTAVTLSGGTLFVAGGFNSANAGVGGAGAISGPGPACAFVLALDPATGAAVTAFSSDGVQFFGGASTSGTAFSVAAGGGSVYLCGTFTGSDGGIGGPGAAQSASFGSAFIVAINAATGAAQTAFSGDGILPLNVPMELARSEGRGIAFAAGAVYATGFESGALNVNGAAISAAGAFVVAVNGTTGAAITSFSGDGVQSFTGTVRPFGAAIAAAGGRVYVAGTFSDTDAGIGGTGSFAANGGADAFVVALDAATGAPATGFSAPQKFGGAAGEQGLALAVSGTNVILAGLANSADTRVGSSSTTSDATGGRSFLLLLGLDGSEDQVAAKPVIQGGSTTTVSEDAGQVAPLSTLLGELIVDAENNRYLVGTFSGTKDFNPGVGVDSRTARGTTDAFVTRFNADGTYGWTQSFGASDNAVGSGLALSGGTLYAVGNFTGTSGGIGGPGAVASNPTNRADAFVIALDPATGAARTGFASAGAAIFGATLNDTCVSVTVTGGTVYATGKVLVTSFVTDAYILALDAANGTPRAGFGTSGVLRLGDDGEGYGIAAAGGAIYVAGAFSTTVSIGAGPVSNSAGLFDVFVAALDPATGAAFPGFGNGGIARFGGTKDDIPARLTVSGGTAYVAGYTGSDLAGVLAPVLSGDAFVLALDAATGAARTGFGTAGVVTFGGSDFDAATAVTVGGGSLFVAGRFSNNNAGFSGAGTIGSSGKLDAFLLALDPATGAPRTGFSADGIQTIGGTLDDGAFGVAVAGPDVLVATKLRSEVAGQGQGTSIAPGTYWAGAIVALDTARGGKTLIVRNTRDDATPLGKPIPDSLRDCLQRAEDSDFVLFDSNVFASDNSDAATVISVLSPLPLLDKGRVTLDAQDRRVTVNGSATASAVGLDINSDANAIRGLSLVGFPRSAIRIADGAKNNAIGGDRSLPAGVTRGPNGQGLRIASSGSFGIEISGVGTSGNSVKGCWIGLDPSGQLIQGNLAGILIQGGAKQNVIGSLTPGEVNVVSGNSFEGVTVSGAGSDDNIIVGNLVGMTADSPTTGGAQSRVGTDPFLAGRGGGNGSAGVFLSKGTTGTEIGSAAVTEANAIGFNGGNGIELRTNTTRSNASRGNRISRNKGKGGAIFLADGSNNGVPSPKFTSVEIIPGRGGALSRAVRTVRITGTIPPDARSVVRNGSVEIFSDPAEQGETLLGRGAVTGGTFTFEADADLTNKITAVFTDDADNTSSYTMFGGTIVDPDAGGGGDGGGGGGGGGGGNSGDIDNDGIPNELDPDSDNDGFPNTLEALLNSDPLVATSKPAGASDAAPTALFIKKIALKLSFTKTATDALSFSGTLPVPDGTVVKGKTAVLDFGGFARQLTIKEFKLGKPKAGVSTYTVKLAKLDLRAPLADDGFTTTGGGARTAPITLFFDAALYTKSQPITFTVSKKLDKGSGK